MSYTRCPNGHTYNTDLYSSCPHCAGNAAGEPEPTMPASSNGYPMPEFANSADFVNQTRIEDFAGQPPKTEIYGTKPVSSGFESGATIAIYPGSDDKKYKKSPVLGWVVCVEGPDTGMDFRFSKEQNTIGRSNPVQGRNYDISLSDEEVTRQYPAATIQYYKKLNKYYLVQGNGSLVLLNGAPVSAPIELKSHDRIEVGSTSLLFIPVCDDTFCWME